MRQPFIQVFDEATGEYTHREMTDEEYAEWQAVAAAKAPQEETPTE